MLTNYSQQSSFEQAIIETFGGDRPCEVCKFIQAGDTESFPQPEQKNSESKSFKLLIGRVTDICVIPAHSKVPYRLIVIKHQPSLLYEVPTPPPRAACS